MRKQHILEEIRRCAASNAGVPLGRERFERETGIKESDWSGKYWVRWNDALAEAGFKPNKLNAALADDYLLEQYALFVRELGRLPVYAELLLKRRTDSNFPSGNTFSRFGGKAKLAKAAIDYCRKTPGFGDIALLCESPEGHHREEQTPDNEVTSTKSEDGHVYLLHFGRDEYKIGCSNNVERRFREIKTQMPYDGKIIHTITTGDPEGIEAYWHQYFKDKRLKGEWFKLSASDIKYFKKRKLM